MSFFTRLGIDGPDASFIFTGFAVGGWFLDGILIKVIRLAL